MKALHLEGESSFLMQGIRPKGFEGSKRQGPRKPLPKLEIFPLRPIQASSKYCSKCNSKESRIKEIQGPLTVEQALRFGLVEKKPRVSDSKYWRYFGIGWLVNTDQSVKYRIMMRVECPKCRVRHLDKEYIRSLSRIQRLWLSILQFTGTVEFVPYY